MADPDPSEETEEPSIQPTAQEVKDQLVDVDVVHVNLYNDSSDVKVSPENIDERKGDGVVATKMAPRAAVLFSEFCLVMDSEDELASWAELDCWVANQLKGLNPAWIRKFFDIPAPNEETRGRFAARFTYGNVPLAYNGQKLKALGELTSKLNHACVPNAHLQLIRRREAYTTFKRIFCRANRDIEEGEEITLAYHFLDGPRELRQWHIDRLFGFHCACDHCINPQISVEGDFGYLQAYVPEMLDPVLIAQKPARLLKLAYGITLAYLNVGVRDDRLANILEICARICGYHADAGRAHFFATLAAEVYILSEGADTDNGDRMEDQAHQLDLIPGYGTSRRGVSFKDDAKMIDEMKIRGLVAAFMLNAADHKYIMLSRVHDTYDSESDGLEIDEAMRRLEIEKKEHDEERRQQGEKEDRKGKGKNNNKKNNNGQKGKGDEALEGDEEAEEADNEAEEEDDPGGVAEEMGRLRGMGGRSSSGKKGKKKNKGKKKGKGKRKK